MIHFLERADTRLAIKFPVFVGSKLGVCTKACQWTVTWTI